MANLCAVSCRRMYAKRVSRPVSRHPCDARRTRREDGRPGGATEDGGHACQTGSAS